MAKQYWVAAIVVMVLVGGGGLFYYHANSPKQLAVKAQIAMGRGDSTRAVGFLRRAMDRKPDGELGAQVRRLLARALIDAGRESDARPYLEEVLTQNPQDDKALDLLAESHTRPPQRKLSQALRPLSDQSLADVDASIAQELESLEQMPQTPRNEIAQAQLHRLYYELMDDQRRRTLAAIEEASLVQNTGAEDAGRQKLTSLPDPEGRRERAAELLQNALNQAPTNIRAAELLLQYQYQDQRFAEVLALYRQFQENGPMSPELVITAANAIIADAQHQPDYRLRYAAAQKELETYLVAHEKEAGPPQAHILVAIGMTMLEQGKLEEAMATAQKATAIDAKNLDAQLLLINCKVRQKNTGEALSLIVPLTNSSGGGGVPQVWHLLGLINADLGNLQPAEDAFRKALSLNSAYTPARRALLVTLVRAGKNDAANLVASQEIREDRYFIPAWSVTVEDFRKRGQNERAKAMLLALAGDEHIPAEALPGLVQLLLDNSLTDQAAKLTERLPANPKYRVGLAEAQAKAGDEPAAFRTLEELRSLGETEKGLAENARLKLLISLGLLKEATAALAAMSASPDAEDFASMLMIGQGWMKVGRFDEAKKMLAGIPVYASEYPAAAAELASLNVSAGDHDAAIEGLKQAITNAGKKATIDSLLKPALFQTYLRVGNPAAALAIAKEQAAMFPTNTPLYRNWTVLAATAARESGDYDEAVRLLEMLDPESRKAAAMDIAMLHLLNNKGDLASLAVGEGAVPDASPVYAATTLRLIGGEGGGLSESQAASLLATGQPSTVYAVLSVLSPEQQKAHASDIEKNQRVLPGDIETLLSQVASRGKDNMELAPGSAGGSAGVNVATEAQSKNPRQSRGLTRLRQVALSKRLLEIGWFTNALAVLDQLDQSTGTPLTISQIQRFESLSELRRDTQAKTILDAFALQLKAGKPVAPGVRIVYASQASLRDRNEEAIAALEPLISLNRPALLATIAGLHEKLGQLDQAVALNLQVKAMEPDNLLAANNLAYTLCASDPTNKATLAQALSTIQPAVDKAPQIPAFQDTLGWIEILSGKAPAGTQRIARVLPALRLNAAVHYHLGIGYSKTGQPELARLHLQNVQYLAKSQPIPELALATEALKKLKE
ncbi:MAG: tetratricopeptide repeat protein [Phycisphaerales bacterium]|nr:tetratricopeptide repeat protein [Phycisphaerales bacterium]